LGIIHSSEQSGKLTSGILHYTKLEAQTLSLQDDALAEWLPRMVYTLIVLWIAYSLVGSKVGSLLAATAKPQQPVTSRDSALTGFIQYTVIKLLKFSDIE
jgi:hypothetical protein